MAGWNKPSAANQPTVKKGGAKAPSKVKGIVAGLVTVCALGGLCLWMFSGGDDAAKDKTAKGRGRIKDVESVKMVKSDEAASASDKGGRSAEKPGSMGAGVAAASKLPPIRQNSVVTCNVEQAQGVVEKTFTENADRQIANLILLEPGDEVVGDDSELLYSEFKKDFLDSIKTITLKDQSDTPFVAELKKAVNDVRLDLKVRLDNGEDIQQIMIDTRKNLRELSVYRSNLEEEVNKITADGELTAEEMKDYVDAANALLEQRGAKKLAMPEFIQHRLEMQQAVRRQGGERETTEQGTEE